MYGIAKLPCASTSKAYNQIRLNILETTQCEIQNDSVV